MKGKTDAKIKEDLHKARAETNSIETSGVSVGIL
jgi:hypothetical protein